MKKTTFLMILAVIFASNLVVQSSAQDAVHGINGYYAYTAKQLESENIMELDNNGKKLAAWSSAMSYENGYLKVQMGVNNVELKNDGDTRYFDFRTGIRLKESVAGQGNLTITKEYPVVAFKFSMPFNNERVSGHDYMEPEFRWYNPVTGAKERIPLGGLDNNGRKRLVEQYLYLRDVNGKDSLKFNTRILSNGDTTMWAYRVDDPLAEVVYFLDFSEVFLLEDYQEYDRFKTSGFSFGFFARADTLKTTAVYGDAENPTKITGYTASEETKSKDELPTYYFKWLRTFKSKEEFKEFVSYNNGDGNDPRTDNQLLLNTRLYHANEFLTNYKFADESVKTPFQSSFDEATAIYQSTPPNDDKESAEYKAWDQQVLDAIDDLNEAQSLFLSTIALTIDDYYNTIKTADESYGIILGAETTIGSLSGRPLTVGAADVATGFVFNEIGEINGQRAYKLITSEGTVVVADDKTLMLVAPGQETANNTASFVFSNRADNEYPSFDMKVGSKFYYVGDDNTLKMIDALPDADALDELYSYLFIVSEGVYDNSGNESATNPDFLFSGWEFDADSKTIDNERLTLPEAERTRYDGWGQQRWRMYTTFTVEDVDGSSCLAMRAAPTYYDALDAARATPLTTSFPVGVAMAREHGVYSTDVQRDPDGGVRDSTYIVYFNAYTRRYLAMKWGSPSADVTFDILTFYLPQDKGNLVVTASNIAGQKGDVIYWDILKLGAPYGDKGYPAQFISFGNVQSPDDVVYLDWVRTYSSVDEIPEETFSFSGSGVNTLNDNSAVRIFSPASGMIGIKCNTAKASTVTVYSVNGSIVAQQSFNSTVTIPVNQAGFYIVSVSSDNQKHIGKIIVR